MTHTTTRLRASIVAIGISFLLCRAAVAGDHWTGVGRDQLQRCDRLASFRLGQVEAARRMPMDSAVGGWAFQALQSPTGPAPRMDPVRIRMMGGSVPTVNPDNNQHARDAQYDGLSGF